MSPFKTLTILVGLGLAAVAFHFGAYPTTHEPYFWFILAFDIALLVAGALLCAGLLFAVWAIASILLLYPLCWCVGIRGERYPGYRSMVGVRRAFFRGLLGNAVGDKVSDGLDDPGDHAAPVTTQDSEPWYNVGAKLPGTNNGGYTASATYAAFKVSRAGTVSQFSSAGTNIGAAISAAERYRNSHPDEAVLVREVVGGKPGATVWSG